MEVNHCMTRKHWYSISPLFPTTFSKSPLLINAHSTFSNQQQFQNSSKLIMITFCKQYFLLGRNSSNQDIMGKGHMLVTSILSFSNDVSYHHFNSILSFVYNVSKTKIIILATINLLSANAFNL